MSRVPAFQVAGQDLIDKLFFNQTLVWCLFTEEHRWLKDLDADIDRELTDRNVTGVQRQVVRHGVLCMMEIALADSLLQLREVYPVLPALPPGERTQQFEENEKFRLEFFQASILAALSKIHQCGMDVVIEIANALLNEYREAPPTVRYRLVERMFAFEFEEAPIDCYTWLARMGVVNSAKHPGVALEVRYSPEFQQRLALLCEFDMQRDYQQRTTRLADYQSVGLARKLGDLSPEARELLLAQEIKELTVNSLPELKNSFPCVSLEELENRARIQHFFGELSKYATRFRVMQGDLSGWVGMLCGGWVEVLHRVQAPNMPIYAGEFNQGTLTQLVSQNMSERGLEITASTIYDRHRDFKETILEIVAVYYRMKRRESVAAPPDLPDMTYDGLAPYFELRQPKPRRPSRKSERTSVSE